MTASVQFASFSSDSSNSNNRYNRRSLKFFQVDIENFDHETESYEVEARDHEHAAEIALAGIDYDAYNVMVYEC